MSRVPGVVSITDLARRASACLWSERQYLAWLAAADLDNDPLTRTDGRDWAVRDYRTHLNLQREGVPSPSRDATKRRLPASRDSDTVSGRRALGTLPRAADPPRRAADAVVDAVERETRLERIALAVEISRFMREKRV